MSGSSDQPTRDDVAAMEAAEWFAKRTAGSRTNDAAEFNGWLTADWSNRAAYASAENIWSELDDVLEPRNHAMHPAAEAAPRRTPWRAPAWGMAVAVCVALLSVTWLFARQGGEAIETGVGAQQIAKLEDGTLVSLNTATRLEIRYDDNERAVRFDRGEAMFEVAHDPSRPFIVSVENYRVRALGTSFVIRSDVKGTWVALIEGSVRVSGVSGATAVLQPGERLALSGDGRGLDRPELGSLTAWRHGELVFDRTPLVEAIFEINRYTDKPVILADPRTRHRRVTGRFRVDRSEEFAESIATLYGLEVVKRADSIEIRPAD